LDALELLADDCECFRCEHCSGELVVETDAKIASHGSGDGGDHDNNARRRRLEKLEDMQRRTDEQLEPLLAQIQRVEGLAVPEFMSLQSCRQENNIGAAAVVPYRGETDVEVGILLPGSGSKVFPPWMLKQGMDHTRHTGGQTEKSEGIDDDKKMNSSEEKKKQAYTKMRG
jgi:transcription initiation factor TFIIE subunit alpha